MIKQCGDRGRRALQRFRLHSRQVALTLVDRIKLIKCNKAAYLGFQQGYLVSCIKSGLHATDVNPPLQHSGGFRMTLQRLQIQTEAQQLLDQTGCEGASAFFHGFDVLAIDTQCTGLSAGWRRAFGLQWYGHIDYDGRHLGWGGFLGGGLCG